MNEDRFAGTAKNLGGRVEQGFGRATGDVKTETEGKIKQATPEARSAAEKDIEQHPSEIRLRFENLVRPLSIAAA